MSDSPEEKNQKDINYWKSLSDLHNDLDFLESSHQEFSKANQEDFTENKLNTFSRRKFLALIGASAALAGAVCSSYSDKGDIVPYNKKPEEILPCVPNYYASTCTLCSNACGILIKTREGRPIKLDGNPDHPVNRGKICTKGHASIMNLYDPERLKYPVKKSGSMFNKFSWREIDSEIIDGLNKVNGKEIAIITNNIFSPTALKLIEDFKIKYPTAKHYSYDLINDMIRESAWQKSGGTSLYPIIKWDEARVIVALESDFLGVEGNSVENSILFSKGRDVNNLDKFNRLYVIESTMSVTGMNADYRIRLRPDAMTEFINVIATGNNIEGFAKRFSISSKTIHYLIKDLKQNRSKSIIYAGNRLPEEVHIEVNKLNNSIGASALYKTDNQKINLHNYSTTDELKNLINNMNAGNVGAVIHFDSNPVFHFPSSLRYKDAINKVPLVITYTELENESSDVSHYVLPINNQLESWGDAQTRSGIISLQQPVISPLLNTRQKEASLLSFVFGAGSYNENIYHDYIMKNWESTIFNAAKTTGTFNDFWQNSLHDGVVVLAEDNFKQNLPVPLPDRPAILTNGNYILILKESYNIGDGKLANNGWLQELPHPVSKIVWDNYAAISQKTAKELNVVNNDLIKIETNGQTLTIPIFIQPGTADKTFNIEIGNGRRKTGIVGSATGFNAIDLISFEGGLSPYIYQNIKVSKHGGTYLLASTQEHYAFDNDLTKDQHLKRNIIREGTISEYINDKKFIQKEIEESKKNQSLYGKTADNFMQGVKWGMAIDLNKCLGCGECVIACNSENNIPVVGKDQVAKSREMQWLRVDRYYSGSIDEPIVSTQLMLCQHCDNAPCENVCPVAATTHSNDGLNQMVYNRCVGTRYCSNNCPYKVRRFNFYNFRDRFKDGYQENNLFNLIYNPEVTVRSRGVMEKCTFCIQRIMTAREGAIRDGRKLKGTDVTTACQDACVTEAISFGDMHDSDSVITKLRQHDLAYYVLDELNTVPNVTYIAKLRNTHRENNSD